MLSFTSKVILGCFVLITMSICKIEFNENELRNYQKSIHDSFTYHDGKREKIIPISETNKNFLRYEEGNEWICMIHWSSDNCGTLSTYTRTDRDIWTVLCSQVFQFLSENHLENP